MLRQIVCHVEPVLVCKGPVPILLKNMRSSQIFSVCGLPDVKLHRNGGKKSPKLQVELLGMDMFDPTTLDVDNRPGSDVPAWLLDTDYNDLCFHRREGYRRPGGHGLERGQVEMIREVTIRRFKRFASTTSHHHSKTLL